MKTKLFEFVATIVLFFALLSLARADSVDGYVNKYYPLLKANKYEGAPVLVSRFLKEVPDDEQAEVLARIFERASAETPPDVTLMGNMLGLSAGFQDKKIKWNDHLKNLIYAQAKSSNPDLRGFVIRMLAKQQNADAHDLVLAALNDSSEEVRCDALDGLQKWPNAVTIYNQYIQTHQGDASYSKSLKYAQDNLNALQQQGK